MDSLWEISLLRTSFRQTVTTCHRIPQNSDIIYATLHVQNEWRNATGATGVARLIFFDVYVDGKSKIVTAQRTIMGNISGYLRSCWIA